MKTVTLQPISMAVPNKKCIYTPSRREPVKIMSAKKFAGYSSTSVLVSFEPDGISNPVQRTAYGRGLDCWYLRV